MNTSNQPTLGQLVDRALSPFNSEHAQLISEREKQRNVVAHAQRRLASIEREIVDINVKMAGAIREMGQADSDFAPVINALTGTIAEAPATVAPEPTRKPSLEPHVATDAPVAQSFPAPVPPAAPAPAPMQRPMTFEPAESVEQTLEQAIETVEDITGEADDFAADFVGPDEFENQQASDPIVPGIEEADQADNEDEPVQAEVEAETEAEIETETKEEPSQPLSMPAPKLSVFSRPKP